MEIELSPTLYHHLVRPRFFTRLYIENLIKPRFSLSGRRVLDFGSGTGANSVMFETADYYGIDADAKRIEYAKQLYPEYRFTTVMDELLPFPNDYFDFILIVAVLHHIPPEQLARYLLEFQRVLKPGGMVLVMEPCFRGRSPVSNGLMALFDRGKYILHDEAYLEFFRQFKYETNLIKTFKKFFYNEVFFTAAPKIN